MKIEKQEKKLENIEKKDNRSQIMLRIRLIMGFHDIIQINRQVEYLIVASFNMQYILCRQVQVKSHSKRLTFNNVLTT